MGKKLNDAVDQIAALVPQPVPKSWEHRVAEEHRETLEQIRAGYLEGRFGASKIAAAKAISQWLNANGISHVGHQGVLEWLAK